VLARFDLDPRIERFLLSHLSAIKEAGKLHVKNLLESTLSIPMAPAQTLFENPDVQLHTQELLDVLLDSPQRGTVMGSRTREDIAGRLLRKRKRASQQAQIETALDWLEQWVEINARPEEAFPTIETLIDLDPVARQTLGEWRTTMDLLAPYDISSNRVTIQPALARSWEYYTGVVFELRANNDIHLGGGGRYDELARLMGSKALRG
jgi:histidyl-tRNA synthetase